jgi:hypothetical protein
MGLDISGEPGAMGLDISGEPGAMGLDISRGACGHGTGHQWGTEQTEAKYCGTERFRKPL